MKALVRSYLLNYLEQRRVNKRLRVELEKKVLSVVTYTGSNIPNLQIRVLGSVAAANDMFPDEARFRIRHQAYLLGANYIINYREEKNILGVSCIGDAVLAQ